jgi:hypothetical protein
VADDWVRIPFLRQKSVFPNSLLIVDFELSNFSYILLFVLFITSFFILRGCGIVGNVVELRGPIIIYTYHF